tara:strand:- start:63454 stop:63741 length:288 start_codon:yes stop_codon:yes gene_type:complete
VGRFIKNEEVAVLEDLVDELASSIDDKYIGIEDQIEHLIEEKEEEFESSDEEYKVSREGLAFKENIEELKRYRTFLTMPCTSQISWVIGNIADIN